MTKQEIAEKTLEILCNKFSIEKQEITPDLSFDNMGLGSLDLVEVILDIEDNFNIIFPDDIAFMLYINTSISVTNIINLITDCIDNLLKYQYYHRK